MRILAGLITPDEGRVVFDGEDVLKNIDNFRYKIDLPKSLDVTEVYQ